MTLYLDTSVIVKLYIHEEGSESIVAEVGRADLVMTSLVAYPEACAVFEQRRRTKSITPATAKGARQALDADWSSWFGVGVDADLAHGAARLAEKHGLRGADAIHLASFERVLISAEDDDVRFLCADERLSKAARGLGWRAGS